MHTTYEPLCLPAGPETENKTPHEIIQDYKADFNRKARYENMQTLLYEALTAKGGLTPESEDRAEIIFFVQYLWAVDQALDLLYPTNGW